jgi:hypothetical protein
MKTNIVARGLVRIRVIVICLALIGLVGVEIRLGESLAARFGQITAPQTENPQAPNVSLGDLMATASGVR